MLHAYSSRALRDARCERDASLWLALRSSTTQQDMDSIHAEPYLTKKHKTYIKIVKLVNFILFKKSSSKHKNNNFS